MGGGETHQFLVLEMKIDFSIIVFYLPSFLCWNSSFYQLLILQKAFDLTYVLDSVTHFDQHCWTKYIALEIQQRYTHRQQSFFSIWRKASESKGTSSISFWEGWLCTDTVHDDTSELGQLTQGYVSVGR